MIVGTAGVPVELGETRDYDLIFSQLEAAGVEVYFPFTQYQENPTAQSLGFETDFLPPPFGTADPSVYEAMRAHGIKLAINAEFLYDLNEPFPPAELDPLRALIEAAGRDLLYGVYGADEPAFRDVDPAVSQRLYEHIKSIDTTLSVIQVHRSIDEEDPVMMTQEGRDAYLADVLAHAQWADIVGFDVYAVGASVGATTPYSNGELVSPAQAVRDYMTWLAENLPDKLHTMVLQGFSPADLYSPDFLAQMDPDLIAASRGPTAQEMHDMLAATEGAEAVFWWGQSHLKDTSSETWQNLLAETNAWVDAHGGSGMAVIVGTAGDDTLQGGAAADRLVGGAGQDLLAGGGGNDTLVGGSGDDTMRGGTSDDTYYVDSLADVVDEASGDGVDEVRTALAAYSLSYKNILGEVENLTGTGLTGQSLTGNGAANVIAGSWGGDTLDGGGNADTMSGGGGDDIYIVAEVGDIVSETGGSGIDEIRTTLASYSLDNANVLGAVENLIGLSATGQTLVGNSASNEIRGGAGNDTLDGGAEADTLRGGAGNDVYLADMLDIIEETDGSGNDEIRTSDEYYSLAASNIRGDIETLTGTAQTGQYLVGSDIANVIQSGSGDDVLDGGAGADTLRAGAGNDYYMIDNIGDAVVEAAGEGTDTLRATISFTLGPNVENLFLEGSGNINGSGNGADNIISGTSGDNVLNGGGGNDALAGGDGDDLYVVDSVLDMVLESSADAAQVDTVRASVSYALGANLERLALTGSAAINGAGNELANQITGNSGANWLIGGLGADTISGAAGDDIYLIDNAGDVVIETAGAGSDQVATSVSYTLTTSASIELFTTDDVLATTALNLTGNAFAQTIVGNNGANTINGGGGVDTMQGGDGNDRYLIDNAGDVVVETAAAGTDRIMTAVSYVLAAGVSIEEVMTTNALATTALNLTGNAFAQTIVGNNGNNTINGGGGADRMDGQRGDDIYLIDNVGDVVIETAGAGSDRVSISVSYTLATSAAIELFTTTNANGATAINLTGNELAQTIVGNNGANVINGGGGADTMQGGGGNDRYLVDNAGDVVVETAAAGTDRIMTAVSYVLAAGVSIEEVMTTNALATTALNLTGNAIVQTIVGNNGANVIDGGGGNDTLEGLGGTDRLTGGIGNDTLTGGAGADSFIFNTALNAATNVDTITDFSVPGDTIQLENAIFTKLGAAGALASSAFHIGAAAADATDRIIYNSATGALSYDADGFGGGAAIRFAALATGIAMTNADFLVI